MQANDYTWHIRSIHYDQESSRLPLKPSRSIQGSCGGHERNSPNLIRRYSPRGAQQVVGVVDNAPLASLSSLSLSLSLSLVELSRLNNGEVLVICPLGSPRSSNSSSSLDLSSSPSMELSFVSSRSLSPIPSASSSSSSSSSLGVWIGEKRKGIGKTSVTFRIRSSAERSQDRIDEGDRQRAEFAAVDVPTPATTAINRSLSSAEAEFPVWEKLGAIVRLSYGIGVYGAMALAGKFICEITGIDCTGGFHPSLKAIVDGLGYAAPPIMALLFILDDEVVKYSPHARAIRDVEDEELRSFFYGMSPWQFILIVIASSVGEELFYRVAVQGALADMFLRGADLVKDARGIASLTGMLPLYVPFAQAFAAVITAALTGSLYYVATAPKDPTYVVAPVLHSRPGREDLKKLFAAWYERRQMKKIYSPLLEGLLALYLGFEWIQTDNNILAPMITHGIYSAVVLGHGLWKIHDHRRRLRQRIQQVRLEARNSNKS